MAGGGFESKREKGAFPSNEKAEAAAGAVTSVNGHKGDVKLTASDVGAYTRGESESNFEKKISTGTIQQADDPKTKPEGDYYVTEKFVGAPDGLVNYVGVMSIRADYDGSDNGTLIIYVTDSDVYYAIKYTGGWSNWISINDYANKTFLNKKTGGTVESDLFVHGELTGHLLGVSAENEIGLLITGIDDITGVMQPLDERGNPVPNTALTFKYDTKKWYIDTDAIVLQSVFNALKTRVKLLEDNSGITPPPQSDLIKQLITKLESEGKLNTTNNKFSGGVKRFENLAQRTSFTNAQENKQFLYKSLALIIANNDGDPELYYWSGAKADGTDGSWQYIDFSGGQPTTAGIMLKDATKEAAGVSEIDIMQGLEFQIDKDDPKKATLLVDPQFYFDGKPSAYLAGMTKDRKILPTGKGEIVFFDMPMTPAGEGIVIGKDSYAIQDPTRDDPNVTGGTPTEILSAIGFRGNAPEDGRVTFSVRVKQLGQAESYLLNPNGKPIVYQREVKQGQRIKPMFLAGLVQAKGLEYIRLYVSSTFKSSDLVIDHAKSFLCFQQLTGGWRTSEARNTFESKSGISLTPLIESFGANILTTTDEFKIDLPEVDGNAGDEWDDLDVIGLHSLTKIKVSVSNGMLNVSDNGVDIADFMIDMAADNHKTKLLRNHTVTFTAEVVDKNAGWNFNLYYWDGEPDVLGKLYDSRDSGGSGVINVNPNFKRIATSFISESPQAGTHSVTVSARIPKEANNIVAVLYPVEPQQPITLKLKSIAMSTTPFTSYIDTVPELAHEVHLEFSEKYARFIQNTQGYASLRYTYNAREQPAPTGIQFKGSAPIAIDPTINKIAGSQARGGEGAYQFNFDGTVSVSTTVSASNETGNDSTMTLLYKSVAIDGELQGEIPDSRVTFTVKASDKNVEHSLPAFDLQVQSGYRIAPRIIESATDGGYLECDSDRQPLLETTFDIKQLTP